jgi:hypothetical protein
MNVSKLALLTVMAGSLSINVFAEAKTKTPEKKTVTAKVAGMQVAIDSKTGRIRKPTAEERAKLAKALGMSHNRSAEGLKVTRYANGMQRVDLNGRFQTFSLAKIGKDGKVKERCVTDQAEAKAFLNGADKTKKSNPTTAEVK